MHMASQSTQSSRQDMFVKVERQSVSARDSNAPCCPLQSLASQLFAASLFPYLAFLYYLTRSGKMPRLALGGFWFLLVFVGATIPAGIYGEWSS